MESKFRYREFKDGDAEVVAADLRTCDKEEVEFFLSKKPLEAIKWSVGLAERAFTITENGRPVAIFGCIVYSSLTGHATPFFFAVSRADELPYRFAKYSRELVLWIGDIYTLYTVVMEKHDKIRQWLQWLGFKEGTRNKVNGVWVIPVTRERG
jgi:hypothetical protein